MKFFNDNAIQLARENTYYRKVLFTDDKSQLVLMCLQANQEIPEEVHQADQIIIIVEGVGKAILNGVSSELFEGHILVIPLGTTHAICNTGSSTLKIITIYTPPQHKPGTIHKTKEDEKAY
jgi:mannose-6-phosphate isomerase-like protein (cupin superfamily)